MSARILTLAGTVHPKAEVQSVDAEHGIALFRWLDAGGEQVDSGGSIVRFAPLEPDADGAYPAVDDATLIAAIENPPADPEPIVVVTPLTVISRLTDAEKVAIFTSTDPEVCVWRGMATAAQEIRSDDPRTSAGFALLVSKGILAANRPAELLAP